MEQKEAKTMMEILQSAIQMEIDGKEFYQRASQQSSTPSKQLFERLAIEEDEHRRKFEEIYEALNKRPDWPAVEAPSSGGKRLRSIFAEASKKLGTQINPSQSELDAIKQAMNMELKSYEFYRSRSQQGASPLERQFYQSLAAEERGHYLALVDSYEYLTDPAGWFTVKEHWTLEG